jgi:hypothetical protein
MSVVTFLKDLLKVDSKTSGKVLGSASGSPKTQTPKRAKQRAKRRALKLMDLRNSQVNPAGSKLLRRYVKAAFGHRVSYEEAYNQYSKWQ